MQERRWNEREREKNNNKRYFGDKIYDVELRVLCKEEQFKVI